MASLYNGKNLTVNKHLIKPAGSIPPTVPKILLFSGLDPSGGAGLQADIQTCSSLGCHALPLLTANTIQNTHNAAEFKAESALWLRKQLSYLLDDIAPDAVKIGAISCSLLAQEIGDFIRTYTGPIIYDPVIKAGGGTTLADTALIDTVKDHILPSCTLITPNAHELSALSNTHDESEGIRNLTKQGCPQILITGGHDSSAQKSNRLYIDSELAHEWRWNKLPGEFRGTGCALSTAITVFLAQKHSLSKSCVEAHRYVERAVANAYAIGSGQLIPDRLSSFHLSKDG